jgi:phosphatidylserine decarboxylase
MATAPTAPPPSTSAPITSVQPGGGICMSLELAWGRLRRALLRRFRPSYVRRMAERRQGECPDCPHDILDARDLKYYRNVCGHWFRPEDDPFAWRGRLGLARHGLAEVVVFSAGLFVLGLASGLLGALVHPLFWLPLPIVVVLWLFVIAFFRDPARAIPAGPDLLLSPADGTVTNVGAVDDADFPGGRAFRVSIFLSVFNVHVNRQPRSGRVAALRYFPGEFLDARDRDSARRNEQLWIDLDDAATRARLRIKQIAGAIARRIVCWLRPSEDVRAGERLGLIKFGSRTDVLLPVEAVGEVTVKVGDRVRGGESVLLRMRGGEVVRW